jgi:TatD DNase family protein
LNPPLLIASISQTNFIGEIGIDGSTRYANSFEKQELIFESAIRECQRVGGRTISIHSRNSVSKIISILKKYPNSGKPVFHWFTGSTTELKKIIDMQCYFSINPLMLKSLKGKELISRIPKNLVLPESDGPFATLNGKPIMPWEAINVCDILSKIWNIPLIEAKQQVKENLKKITSLQEFK